MNKNDPELGIKVNEHLKKLGLQNPWEPNEHFDDHVGHIEDAFAHIHGVLGLDLADDSIKNTPQRLAKMWVNEMFWGLHPENFPRAMDIQNKIRYDQMIVEQNIKVMSVCEHHWMPIHGTAAVAYIPDQKVCGLSKLNRIVEYFSRRPQVQERLTQQIGETVKFLLETDDVAVSITANHYCVIARGIQDMNSFTSTSFLSGSFKDKVQVRGEFYSLVNR